MIKLKTKRLILRSNCRVVNGIFEFPPIQEISLEAILDKQLSQAEDGGFAIYLKAGKLIGHILIYFKRKPYELSVSIDEPYRRKGYMSEAQDEVIQWIFDNCDTRQINVLVGPITPIASRRLCEKNGFHKVMEANHEWWVLNKEDFKLSKKDMITSIFR